MNRFNYGLLAGVLAIIPVFSLESLAAEGCTTVPTCSELGYSQKAEDCMGKQYLKCPFNNDNIYCGEDCSDYTLTACDANKGTVKICEGKCKYTACNSGYELEAGNCVIPELKVGDILFGDGTTSAKIVSGKTPIGIVFDTENKLAVALTDVNSNGAASSTTMQWSSISYNIPDLANCTSSSTVTTSCSVDGRANTTAILNCGSSCGTTYAVNGANAYEPSGCSKDFCKKTKWFLPSMRDLQSLYNAKSYVNASLSLTASNGSKTLTESYYWSSTEYNIGDAWRLRVSDGYKDSGKYGYSYYVRPVIDFSNPDYVAPSCSAGYNLSSCDSFRGTCEECGGKYKYTKCNNGYNLKSGDCIVRTCPTAIPQSIVTKRCSDYYLEGGYQGTQPCYCCNSCTADYPILNGGRCYTQEEISKMGGDDAPCGM